MVGSCPLRLLGHRALLAALRLWLKTARLCNMHMERTLSQITRSAPKRGHIERLIGSGFLVQLQALHASAGGNDTRNLTRAQPLKDGAPLRASKRKRRQRRGPTQASFLHVFNKRAGWAAAPHPSAVPSAHAGLSGRVQRGLSCREVAIGASLQTKGGTASCRKEEEDVPRANPEQALGAQLARVANYHAVLGSCV